jgi:hypothetical protein
MTVGHRSEGATAFDEISCPKRRSSPILLIMTKLLIVTKLQELKRHLRPGKVYRCAELAQCSNAVDRHLKQLPNDGTLTKLAPGLYAYPKETVFGKAPAGDDKSPPRIAIPSEKESSHLRNHIQIASGIDFADFFSSLLVLFVFVVFPAMYPIAHIIVKAEQYANIKIYFGARS